MHLNRDKAEEFNEQKDVVKTTGKLFIWKVLETLLSIEHCGQS